MSASKERVSYYLKVLDGSDPDNLKYLSDDGDSTRDAHRAKRFASWDDIPHDNTVTPMEYCEVFIGTQPGFQAGYDDGVRDTINEVWQYLSPKGDKPTSPYRLAEALALHCRKYTIDENRNSMKSLMTQLHDVLGEALYNKLSEQIEEWKSAKMGPVTK